MVDPSSVEALARELLDAFDSRTALDPITRRDEGFELADGYRVLDAISAERRARGWVPVGRKIGFTNRTVWELLGVGAPIWAPVWDRTLLSGADGPVEVSLAPFLEPRIEPEVAFGLRGPVPVTDDAEEALTSVDWLAPAFEIVQCLYPGWSFTSADALAAFGLHGRLVVGEQVPVTDENRGRLAADLATFEAVLSRDGGEVDRGVGANVLDSPALALVHLAGVVAGQPGHRLEAGEVITTGTVTNAIPIAPGESWTCDYGSLGLAPLHVTFT